jgi:uncharacterized protein YukE
MKDTLTFDQLPEAVTKMQEKLDNIEQLLLQSTRTVAGAGRAYAHNTGSFIFRLGRPDRL